MAREQVRGRDAMLEPARDRAQQLVAGGGEPGQAVAVGEVGELLLAAVARGHVGFDADHRRPAVMAVEHRRVGDVEDGLADLDQLRHALAAERSAHRGGDLRHAGVDVEHRAAHDLTVDGASRLSGAAARVTV